ncbi:unnamed protein product [Rotaria sp. Silwood1]|nr:unnamed protein product [Rotaria sp. Silwood1]CAF1482355.1 unnamed protein product [Rotaria sp. Silwood1]CAF1529294.1 unnamed protein product [Rotaria sp. Silwood1]CAF3595592.1 unnamed protein product [Rotaria sp. Silwood1]CAF3628790.1 unnamed protein product [Rotaria sp. Silwood1]
MSDNNNEQQPQQTPPVEPNPVNIESKQPINFSTASVTRERTLYIGIKDASKLETYEIQIQNLFTYEHYKQF